MIETLWKQIFVEENGFSADELLQTETALGKPLPTVLKDFYAKYGRYPLNQAHNRLVAPNKLTVDDNGFVVFYEENQGVILWALALADFAEENPIIYESYDNGNTWVSHADKERLSSFLVDVTLFQAIMGGYPFCAGHFGVATEVEQTILEQFAPFATDFVKRGMRYYGNAKQLIAIMEGETSNDLWIACQKKTPFQKLMRQLKLGWDYNSMED